MTSFMIRHPPFNDLWVLLWIFPWIIKGVLNTKKLNLKYNDHSYDEAPGIKRFVKRRLPVLSWPSWAAWAFRNSSAGSRSACDGRRTGCGGRLSSLDSRLEVSKTAQSVDSCRRTRPRARKKRLEDFFFVTDGLAKLIIVLKYYVICWKYWQWYNMKVTSKNIKISILQVRRSEDFRNIAIIIKILYLYFHFNVNMILYCKME